MSCGAGCGDKPEMADEKEGAGLLGFTSASRSEEEIASGCWSQVGIERKPDGGPPPDVTGRSYGLPQPKNRSSVFMVMAVRQGIEIRYSNDGPWITFHAGDSCISYNLRDLAAGLF